jgi:hypothetical protein
MMRRGGQGEQHIQDCQALPRHRHRRQPDNGRRAGPDRRRGRPGQVLCAAHPIPASDLDGPGMLAACRNLKYVERDFRHMKIRPPGPAVHLRPARRARPCPRTDRYAHLLPELIPAPGLGSADLDRRRPARPAIPVVQVRRSRTPRARPPHWQSPPAGRPYPSFRGLLGHLAALTRNQVRIVGTQTAITTLTEPTRDPARGLRTYRRPDLAHLESSQNEAPLPRQTPRRTRKNCRTGRNFAFGRHVHATKGIPQKPERLLVNPVCCSAQRGRTAMHDVTQDGGDDRSLLWIAATNSFIPAALRDWRHVGLVGIAGVIPESVAPSVGYSLIFEATCNSMLKYDPVLAARSVWTHFEHAPVALVAVVAPSLEIPVATQHAIACEVGQVLCSPRVDVVTVTERWSPQSDRKIRKADAKGRSYNVREDPTGLDEALEIAAGKKQGMQVDAAAAAFVYAYTSRSGRRKPFRCTPLQRSILRVVAFGEIVATTSAIARAVHSTEKKVSEGIAELVEVFVPRSAGEPESRDGHHRLHWLVNRYGPWIRLLEGRP